MGWAAEGAVRKNKGAASIRADELNVTSALHAALAVNAEKSGSPNSSPVVRVFSVCFSLFSDAAFLM